MNKRLIILGAALLIGLSCLAAPVLADETGCKAQVTLVGGESLKVHDFGVRLTEDAFVGYEMMVNFDEGQAIIDLRELKSLTRLAPPEKVGSGNPVTFAFVGRKGKQGKFKVDGGYYMCGKFSLGDWTVTAGEVQKIALDCIAPLD